MDAEWGGAGAASTGWIDDYLLAKAGCEKDFKAVWSWWRYRVGGKMFAATMCPGPEHNSAYAGRRLLTLKCDPVWSEQLCAAYGDILPGFYMDKRTWISVDLDGAVPAETMRELCDHSYNLVFAGLTKKLQRAIGEAEERKPIAVPSSSTMRFAETFASTARLVSTDTQPVGINCR